MVNKTSTNSPALRVDTVALDHFDAQRATLISEEPVVLRQIRYSTFAKTLAVETLKNVCARNKVLKLNLDTNT